VAYQLGDPGPFFHEGLAVVLGNDGRYRGRAVDGVAKAAVRLAALPDLIRAFDPDNPGDGYAVAGSFMKWLVARYGLEKVAEFFRAAKGGQAGAAFQSVFARPLADAGAEWSGRLTGRAAVAMVTDRESGDSPAGVGDR
jgi:hypothetical protein